MIKESSNMQSTLMRLESGIQVRDFIHNRQQEKPEDYVQQQYNRVLLKDGGDGEHFELK